MAWFNSKVCGRQRKYMNGSCLMGESFGRHVPNDSIRHDTLTYIVISCITVKMYTV